MEKEIEVFMQPWHVLPFLVNHAGISLKRDANLTNSLQFDFAFGICVSLATDM